MFGLVCAFFVIGISTTGLLSALALRRYINGWVTKNPRTYPRVSVIAPHRGAINKRNIEGLLAQDYPGIWEVLFVTTHDDVAWHELKNYIRGNVRMVVSPDVVELSQSRGLHTSQKNINMASGVRSAAPETEIFAFVDADAYPKRNWLRKLVTPFTTGDPKLGAVTTARIYVPDDGGPSWAQAVWILFSVTLQIGPSGFLWGGCMGIPKTIFDELDLLRHIDGRDNSVIAEDIAIARSLRKNGYHTLFTPECLMVRHPPAQREEWASILRFTNRCILYNWWENKWLWIVSMFHGLRLPVMVCALVAAWWQPMGLLALMGFLIDAASILTAKQVLSPLVPEDANVSLSFRKVLAVALLTPVLIFINTFTAPFRRRMIWGGVEYTKRAVVGYTDDVSWRFNSYQDGTDISSG